VVVTLEGENLPMPGVVTFSQGFFEKIYYRFEFRNLSDAAQKKLFSSIFRKQLELRRSVVQKK
jgi:c-di-GMP-binding flagellar brake protein YcgR